jgi:hypothetical protein
MTHALDNLFDELKLILVILILLGPYLLLFYKNAGIRIRLLFVCLIQVFILCTMMTIDFFGNGVLIYTIFFYNQFVWISIFINVLIIFLSWILTKIKPAIKGGKD